eukprot:6455662-Amphidinium_carterae.1
MPRIMCSTPLPHDNLQNNPNDYQCLLSRLLWSKCLPLTVVGLFTVKTGVRRLSHSTRVELTSKQGRGKDSGHGDRVGHRKGMPTDIAKIDDSIRLLLATTWFPSIMVLADLSSFTWLIWTSVMVMRHSKTSTNKQGLTRSSATDYHRLTYSQDMSESKANLVSSSSLNSRGCGLFSDFCPFPSTCTLTIVRRE